MKSLHNLIDVTTRTAIEQNRLMKQVISQIVPSSTHSHIEFCRLEGGKVRITVDNSVWISKLRFSKRQILAALRDAQLDAYELSFHVSPAEVPVTRKTVRSPNKPSEAAARALTTLADSLDDGNTPSHTLSEQSQATANSSVLPSGDDRLRQELLKLAQTIREQQ